jgi:hypothetical protein
MGGGGFDSCDPVQGILAVFVVLWVLQEWSYRTVSFSGKLCSMESLVSYLSVLSNGTSLLNLRFILQCYKPAYISSGSDAVFAVLCEALRKGGHSSVLSAFYCSLL